MVNNFETQEEKIESSTSEIEKDIAIHQRRQESIERINVQRRLLNLPQKKFEKTPQAVTKGIESVNIRIKALNVAREEEAQRQYEEEVRQDQIRAEEEAKKAQELAQEQAIQTQVKKLTARDSYRYGAPGAYVMDSPEKRYYVADTGERFTGTISGKQYTNAIVYKVDGSGRYVNSPTIDYTSNQRGEDYRVSGLKLDGSNVSTYEPYDKEGNRRLRITQLSTSNVSIDKTTHKFNPDTWQPRQETKFVAEFNLDQPHLKPEYYSRYPQIAKQNIIKQEALEKYKYIPKSIRDDPKKLSDWVQQKEANLSSYKQAVRSREIKEAYKERATIELGAFQTRVAKKYTPELTKQTQQAFVMDPSLKKKTYDVQGVEFTFERTPAKKVSLPASTQINYVPTARMDKAPLTTSLYQKLYKRDPKVGKAIGIYSLVKKEGKPMEKAVLFGGELAVSYATGSVIGSAFGFGVKALASTKLGKKIAFKLSKTKVATLTPKLLKVGTAGFIGASAAKEEKVTTGIKQVSKDIAFIGGFGVGAKFGTKAYTTTTKAYQELTLPKRTQRFKTEIASYEKELPKFQYVRKEPLAIQRTLSGGTISPEKVKWLRFEIDKKIILKTRTQSIEVSPIKPVKSTYEITGQKRVSPKDLVLAYDKLQQKFIPIKGTKDFAVKSALVDKGRYSFETLAPKDTLTYQGGRLYIKSEVGVREAFAKETFVSRPEISFRDPAKVKDLTTFGFIQPVKKPVPISDMLASRPVEKVVTKKAPKIISSKKPEIKQTKKEKRSVPFSVFQPTTKPKYTLYEDLSLTSTQAKQIQKGFFAVPKVKLPDVQTLSISGVSVAVAAPVVGEKPGVMLSSVQVLKPDVSTITKNKTDIRQVVNQQFSFETTPKQNLRFDTQQKTFVIQQLVPKQEVKQQQRLKPDTRLKIATYKTYTYDEITDKPPPPPPVFGGLPFIPRKKEKRVRQPKPTGIFQRLSDYTPSLTAAALNIVGEPKEYEELTGFGVRPIPKRR